MNDPNSFGEILLVEDNPGDVRLTQELLKEGGLDPTIHVVTDGTEALNFLRQRGERRDAPRPDVILLDLHLPQMDAEELLAELDGIVDEIPIIALSGSQAEVALTLNDLEDKIDAYIQKPIDPSEFAEAVRSFDR